MIGSFPRNGSRLTVKKFREITAHISLLTWFQGSKFWRMIEKRRLFQMEQTSNSWFFFLPKWLFCLLEENLLCDFLWVLSWAVTFSLIPGLNDGVATLRWAQVVDRNSKKCNKIWTTIQILSVDDIQHFLDFNFDKKPCDTLHNHITTNLTCNH